MPLTDAQRLAVESRGGALLVSAAAGSGKTKVLVERLMRYVDEGANIDEFLVITYTRAAAGELRSRILSALNERIAASPNDRRLRRQTELCCRASIGTIDSICGRILRDHARLAGIAPDFRVMDPERSDAMRAAVLEHVLEHFYDTLADNPAGAELADQFSTGRDDSSLSDLILRLHGEIQSHTDPREWLSTQREALSHIEASDIADTPWGRVLIEETAEEVRFWEKRLDEFRLAMAEDGREKLEKAYAPSLETTLGGLRELGRAVKLGWEHARNTAVEFPRLGGYRGDDPMAAGFKTARDACKKAAERWRKTFAEDSDTLLGDLRRTAPATAELLRLTEELDRAYEKEKKRQGLVDFSDQEHMVLRMLEQRENGLVDELSGRFRQVLVDEYQDVNACQDGLFTLLSDEGKKLFLVGDVKQSIYRFRLADPTIFLRRYHEWKSAEVCAPGEPGRILLRENFRSRPAVIEAVNHVFRSVMSESLGELDYDDDAALRAGRDYPAAEPCAVEMNVYALPEEDTDERPDKVALEAAEIAHRIRSLVDLGTLVTDGDRMRPADYGDFAILLRSHKAATPRYRAALSALGIPSVAQQGGGFFRAMEITVLLSLLAVIDNPRQDVALIATLRSPLFGFSADDLAAIRALDRDADFYTAFSKAADTMPVCRSFLSQLESYRAIASDLSVEALLERICAATDLFALLSAMPDGETRRENVHLLQDYARQFEQNGYRGLFRFLAWLRRLEARGEEPRCGSAEAGRAVQIISIHHSKGLEYPIVFLAGLGHKFNTSDTKNTVLLHPEMGVGMRVIDTKRGLSYPSAAWRAIAAKKLRETLSEEMRVYYVAMTRAKDRLYMSCLWSKAEEKIGKLREERMTPLDPALLLRDDCPAKWIVRAAMLPGSPIMLNLCTPVDDTETQEKTPAEASKTQACCPVSEDELTRRLDWVYPYRESAELPSKITASTLRELALPVGEAMELMPQKHREARRPELGHGERELTGTERGIAMHAALQYMNFSRGGDENSIRGEIERLRLAGHLTDAQAKAVNPFRLRSFFASEIGKRTLCADEVHRELRFSLLIPAERFFPAVQNEKMLLQGVVDCCIREGDALTIIDYKTDAVTEETVEARAEDYAPQVRAYAYAMERVLGLPVREGVLFFLCLGREVRIPLR